MTRDIRHQLPDLSRRQLLGGLAALSAAQLAPMTVWASEGGKQLNVRLYVEADDFDPIDASGLPDEMLYNCLYRKLIQYRPGAEWAYDLDLAETIEQVDPLKIAFTLKTGQMWSDGFGEITAEDVKFSLERTKDPEMKARNLADLGPFSHVEVTGTHSGIIHLEKPFAPLWTIALPYITGNIVCKKAVEAAGGRITTAIPPTVSGPYRVKEHRPGERWILERNPDFGGTPADFERVDLILVVDEAAAEIAKEAGDLNFTSIGPGSVGRVQANPPAGTELKVHPALAYVWIGLNLAHPKFADERVRMAIQHAIDVPSIMEASYYNVAEPSTGIIAPGLIGHRAASLIAPQADYAKARELLTEAGIDRLEITLNVLNNVIFTTAAQVIQATMAQAGIDVVIEVHESGSFWTLGVASDGDRWKTVELVMKRFSMTPDPFYATAWFTTAEIGNWNWEQFSNAEFDALHEAAMIETDPAKRDTMYQRMQDLMEQSGGYRFITHGVTPNLYDVSIIPATRPDGTPLVHLFRSA